MSSSLVVPVVEVHNNRLHPNASLLSLIDILGYQMVVPLQENQNGIIIRKFKKNELDKNGRRIITEDNEQDVDEVRFSYKYRHGDIVVYFPADTIIPKEWIDKFNVRNYMHGKEKNRIGRIKLRGEPSFGLVVDLPDNVNWKVGDNVAEYYNAEKYIPPIKTTCGDAAKFEEGIDDVLEFYTDIENGRIYVDVFNEGEEVIVTEKIHGCNCFVGIISGKKIASSRRIRRKESENISLNRYWYPWTIQNISSMLEYLSNLNKIVILYGEIYGSGIQKLQYNMQNKIGFRAFDLSVNGKYMNYDDFKNICNRFGVDCVPEIYRGSFNIDNIKKMADGNSTLGGNIREGIVVKSIKERNNNKIGRTILKFIGTEYELGREDDNTDV